MNNEISQKANEQINQIQEEQDIELNGDNLKKISAGAAYIKFDGIDGQLKSR